MKALNVNIQGGVQGVGFRYYAEREAKRHGLKGWVRNHPDGSVQALICGEEDQLQAMLSWFRHGPPAASVTSVDTEDTQLETEPLDFQITF